MTSIPVNWLLLGWKVMQFLPRRSQKSHCKLRLSMHSSQMYAPVKYSKKSDLRQFCRRNILYPDILGWLSNKYCHGIDNVDHFVSYKNSLAIFDSVFSFFYDVVLQNPEFLLLHVSSVAALPGPRSWRWIDCLRYHPLSLRISDAIFSLCHGLHEHPKIRRNIATHKRS